MSAKPDPAEADAAFDRLVEEHGRRVGLFLAQLVRDRELAEDLLQETLLAAFKDRRQLEGIVNQEAWLFAIARNRALDANRRGHRRRRALERLLLIRREPTADPAEAAAVRDMLERHLDANDRALLILRYVHGFDAQELSEVFPMTPEAIRQRLSRLRRRLRLAAGPAEAPAGDLRPRGPQVQRYAEATIDEMDVDLAFEHFLGPLGDVTPLPPHRANLPHGGRWRQLLSIGQTKTP
jgi:RNA polymerase sigma-70 factor (ECF subfamily)